ADRVSRHARPAYAVEAVAAGDEVAVDPMLAAVLAIRHVRLRAVEIVQRDVLGLVNGRQPGRGARFHQIARELGLTVARDAAAAGEPAEIDTVAPAADEDLEAAVDEALPAHPLADPGFLEQIDGHLLEHAGTNSAEHVFAGMPLQQ